jgi:hypothetical protein
VSDASNTTNTTLSNETKVPPSTTNTSVGGNVTTNANQTTPASNTTTTNSSIATNSTRRLTESEICKQFSNDSNIEEALA